MSQKPYYETKRKFLFFKQKQIRFNTPGVEGMLEVPKGKTLLATLRNVDITYGSGTKAFRAVTDMNMNIYRGEVLGLVGESGSGKSTIGRAIIGLTPHSFGEIKIFDKVVPKKWQEALSLAKNLKNIKKLKTLWLIKFKWFFKTLLTH
ncbi:ATP-binding cassette domain-containing protein [Mycoplasma sp. 1458C]|uniref:ATP-binding cassette domain-containing protein n=1 Tax=Mycoplasma sp. 1458C TaxID=3401661 RepID=UPI003AAC295D